MRFVTVRRVFRRTALAAALDSTGAASSPVTATTTSAEPARGCAQIAVTVGGRFLRAVRDQASAANTGAGWIVTRTGDPGRAAGRFRFRELREHWFLELNTADLVPQLGAHLGVQCRQRLVQQQHFGLDGQGHALLLSSGELVLIVDRVAGTTPCLSAAPGLSSTVHPFWLVPTATSSRP
ncbi:hypothetical protein ACPEIC_09910 [Stenotrophomonas sp. NPDC087984]